jgi:hypothetical protein
MVVISNYLPIFVVPILMIMFLWAMHYIAKSRLNRNRLLEIREAASYLSREFNVLEMVAIRGVDDEAALALAAGSIGTLIGKLF